MSPSPVTTRPDATAAEAARLMDELHVRHLPVVEDGRAVGVLSDRELFDAAPERPVRELMHSPAVIAAPADSPASLPSEIALRKIGCVLVVEGGALVGIASQFDLVGAFVDAVRVGHLAGLDDPQVETRMIAEFESVEPGDTLAQAATVMRALFMRHLPLIEGGRVLGMLTDRDLRRARGRGAQGDERVETCASQPAVTVTPHTLLSEAAATMHARKLGALPVVDEERAVGLLTLSDVLDHCARELHLRAI